MLSCFLGKIFEVVEGRNAWQATWNQNYFMDKFYPSRAAACGWVEGRRKRGSTWTISERPAIVAAGSDNAVILASMDAHPFQGWKPVKGQKMTLMGLFESFHLSYARIFIVCSKDLALPARLPFCSHKSHSLGGDWGLSWVPRPSGIELTNASNIIAWMVAVHSGP